MIVQQSGKNKKLSFSLFHENLDASGWLLGRDFFKVIVQKSFVMLGARVGGLK